MTKGWLRALVIAVTVVFIAGCGSSSSGGGGGGDTDTGTATILGPDGSEVTSLSAADPVSANLTGLTANTQYTVKLQDPDGNDVCESSVYTDASGAIPSSQYCYVRDRDTDSFADNGVVDAMILGDGDISHVLLPTKAVTVGIYVLIVIDANAATVAQANVTISADPASTCASNSSGKCARSFLKDTANVYATIEEGTGIADGDAVDVYVIQDRCSTGYSVGASLQDVSGGKDTVTVSFTDGLFTTSTPVWATPSVTGVYDVVIDADQSGTYTAGDVVEIIDQTPASTANPGGLCGVGFTVQDPYAAGSDRFTQIAMDSNRAYQDVFNAGGSDVYAELQAQWRLYAAGVPHQFGVRKYVVVHQDTWTDGDVYTNAENMNFTSDQVESGCTNQQRRLVAPIANLSPGCYDLVFDTNGNGVYDKGMDVIDNIDLSSATTCGFIVADVDYVTISSITDSTGAEVKNGTSTSTSSKVTVTGTLSGSFTASATVRAYAVNGTQQSGALVGTVSDGTFTIANVLMMSGANTIKVVASENIGTASALYGYASATATWQPGGSTGSNSFFGTITWLSLTDMDTHFVKTGGTYTAPSSSSNYTDCHYSNCTQDSDEALLWTTASGAQTTATDTSSGAIARLDLDCIGCAEKTENVWLQTASEVVPEAGNFLLCIYAYSGEDTPSANVSVNGVSQLPLTAPSSISRSNSSANTWFVGYMAQDASGNLNWNAVNSVGGTSICTSP